MKGKSFSSPRLGPLQWQGLSSILKVSLSLHTPTLSYSWHFGTQHGAWSSEKLAILRTGRNILVVRELQGHGEFKLSISGATKCTVVKMLVERKSSNCTIFRDRNKMSPETENKSRKKALLCREEGRKGNKRKFPNRKGKMFNQGKKKRIFLTKERKYWFKA